MRYANTPHDYAIQLLGADVTPDELSVALLGDHIRAAGGSAEHVDQQLVDAVHAAMVASMPVCRSCERQLVHRFERDAGHCEPCLLYGDTTTV